MNRKSIGFTVLGKTFLALLALFGMHAAAPFAFAQTGASVSGKIEDASGGPVSGATVTVKSVETGVVHTATTNAEGLFTLAPLALGKQEVKVEKAGFKTVIWPGIDLQVGQNAAVNLRLEVGELAQQLTVLAESPLVNTTTSPVAGVVTSEEVKDLPLNGRSFDNLIALNPSAIDYTLKSPGTSTSNGYEFSVAGHRPMDNLFLLNGVEYMGSSQLAVTPGGASQQLLGIDAVREFNLLSDTYGAAYGKRAGGQVLIVTQSGSNALHGSVFEFLRNSALDARNFFDGASPAALKRNQFGASLGGPIRKDKLFLFGNYEGFRQAYAAGSVSVVPDANARLGLLPNATTGVLAPAAGLNPAILPYAALWPAANGAELLVNGVASGVALSYNSPAQHIREDFGTARADYILNTHSAFSIAYTIDNGHNVSPLADPLFGSDLNLVNQVASIQDTHTFSANLVNTFTTGFSRAAYTFNPAAFTSFPASLSFVKGESPGGIVVGGGTTTATGSSVITSAGTNNAANAYNRRTALTEADDLRWNKGIHQLSVGVWFQRLRDNEDSASRQLGVATFTSLQTFLTGVVSNFQVIPDPNELGWRSLYGAFYAEDEMKLRRNLTVRVGLRDEFNTGWNEVSGRAANYIPDANGVLMTTPVIGNSIYTQNNAKHLLSPRVGLAWDPWGDGKTAIRAGYGIYYSEIDSTAFLINSLPPTNGSATFSSVQLSSVVPITPGVLPPPSCGPGVPTPCSTFAPQGLQANAQTPTVQEWNLTVEHQIARNTVLRVAYVGSHGYHGLLSVDPNDIPAQVCGVAAGCTAGGTPGTVKTTVPQGTYYIPVQGRPNPYLGAGFFWYTEGNSSYNALQTDITQRLSHGLTFRANYTWSKNLDMNSGLTGAQSNNQAQMILDRNNPRRDWGPAALNPANQASISASYELPWARRNMLLGGWQLNSIVTLLSGFPFTPQVGSNRSGDGDTRNPDRPNINTAFSGPVILGKQTQWFDPAAFLLPAAGTYGNLGRGVYTGPGLADVDVSLFKNFRATERISAQFRAEFFNIMNHTNLGNVNTTVFSNGAPSPTAGLITTTATDSRRLQLGLKLIF
ncbi:MAG TPA: carboxypeptidase-like regulatory domain-containing protein [Bryobacteraceae bacterium]|nr:carboxypeptidase-like regulatory domain-containing protein [Bryobacteraceae bacterium]